MTALQLVDAIVAERAFVLDVAGGAASGAASGACSDLCIVDQETEPLSENNRECIVLCLSIVHDHAFENPESTVLL